MRLKCGVCGKPVSTEVPDGTIVMAFIECPDCIDKDDEAIDVVELYDHGILLAMGGVK